MRTLALVLALYVTVDLGSPFLPGMFAFDPDESVEALPRVGVSSEAPLAVQHAGAWRVDVLPADAPVLRRLVRPRVRPVGVRIAHPRPASSDLSSPADDDEP